METLTLIPLDDSVVFPGMTRDARARRRRRGARPARPAQRRQFASRRHRGRGGRAPAHPGGGHGRDRRGPAPRRRRAPPDRHRRRPAGRGHRAPGRRPAGERAARARARVPRGGRGDPRAARRRPADRRVPALDRRARRAGRHRRLLARPELRAEARAAGDARRHRAAGAALDRCSASAWPSCRCARRIRDDVESGAQQQQREYFLRKQMESIRKELGEDEGSVVDDYRRQDRGGRDARRGA